MPFNVLVSTVNLHPYIAGLWRGNGVMMVRVVPYAGISFMSFPRSEAEEVQVEQHIRLTPPLC